MTNMQFRLSTHELIKYYGGHTENLYEGAEIVDAQENNITLLQVNSFTWHVKSDINSNIFEVILQNLSANHQFWNCTCSCGVQKCKHIAACLIQKTKEPNQVAKRRPLKSMDDLMNILSGHINIDAERQKYTAIYDYLRDVVISKLKEDQFFKKLYNGFKLSGSYADGLKISHPDEFDLVVYLNLPEMEYIKISRDENNRGNALINLTEVLHRLNKSNTRSLCDFLCGFVNEHGELLENRFQHWMESLMSKILDSMNYEITFKDQKFKLRYTKSGPAHTLYVKTENQDQPLFSVDFVPGFQFSSDKYVSDIPPTCKWVAVPLPKKPATNADNASFTASYADEERKMMIDKNQFKNAIKLVKKFRDRNPKMKHIKSYYIKTVFFWLDKEVNDKHFWTKPIRVIIREVFARLEEALGRGVIRNYWVKEKNLLGHLRHTQIKQMHNEVKLVLKKLTEPMSRGNIINIFLSQEEQNSVSTFDRQLIADCFEDSSTENNFVLNALLCASVLFIPLVCYQLFNLVKS